MKTFIKKNKAKFLLIFIVLFAAIQQKCTCGTSDDTGNGCNLGSSTFTKHGSITQIDTVYKDINLLTDTVFLAIYPKSNMCSDVRKMSLVSGDTTIASFGESTSATLSTDQYYNIFNKASKSQEYVLVHLKKTGIAKMKYSITKSSSYAVVGNPNISYCWLVITDNKIPTSVKISDYSETMYAGQKDTLKATVLPSTAPQTVNWFIYPTTDTVYASINSTTGIIRAKTKGNVTVTAYSPSNTKITDTKTISISENTSVVLPTEVTIMEAPPSGFKVGDFFTFQGYVSPTNATNTAIYWTSSDSSIVSINKTTGVSTAKKAGTVTITATAAAASSVTATKSVTVASSVILPTEVLITNQPSSFKVGDNFTFTSSISPSTATNKNIIWSSSDTTIVSINKTTGVSTAKKAGTVTITATAEATSSVKATKNITATAVSVAVTGISFTEQQMTLIEGSKDTLVPTITPSNATNKNLTWTSTDPTIVSVDNNGIISALKIGSCTISATTQDGNFKTGMVVTVSEYVAWVKGTTFSTQGNSNCVKFINSSNGFIVNDDGFIFKTIDAGLNWSTVIDNAPSLFSINFPSQSVGFVVGASGKILKTNDVGATWTSKTSGTTNRLNSVYFTSEQIGFAVGAAGTIIKTSDGGETWSSISSGTTSNLNQIVFISSQNGFIAGSNGLITTTDAGITWISTTMTTSISSICFPTSSVGYLTEANAVYKTTNGGTSWTKLSSFNTSNTVNSIDFADENNGFAVGNSGDIISTTDGGVTWTKQTISDNSPFYSISFPTINKAYTVGQFGIYYMYKSK